MIKKLTIKKQRRTHSFILLVVLCFFVVMSSSVSSDVVEDPTWVSIINLIATPKQYNGKQIFVSGWIFIAVENRSLCLMENPPSGKECLWLNIDDSPNDSDFGSKDSEQRLKMLIQHQGEVVSIHGTFDADKTGHLGGWSGTVHRITDIYTKR